MRGGGGGATPTGETGAVFFAWGPAQDSKNRNAIKPRGRHMTGFTYAISRLVDKVNIEERKMSLGHGELESDGSGTSWSMGLPGRV